MKKLHKLLFQQIERYLGFNEKTPKESLGLNYDFFQSVSQTYIELEKKHLEIEKAMELNSKELLEMNQELQLKHMELQAIHRITTLTQEFVGSPHLYQKLAEEISRATSFPFVAIELLDEKKKTLTLVGQTGIAPEIIKKYNAETPLHHSTSGFVLEESMDFLVSGEIHHLSKDSFWSQLPLQTLINIPLKSSSHSMIFGVLSLGSARRRQVPSRLIQWLKTIGIQLASCFEKRRLDQILKEQEANMISASKMSELGKMAGGIAHEINNPLAMISTQAAIAREICDEANPDYEKLKHFLASIEKTTVRIAKIVSGLRSFSRDGGNDPFREVELSQVIEDTILLCAEKFKAHEIDLSIKIPRPLTVRCRETQISQALLNLLNNAHDAIEHLSEKWIRIEAKDEGENYEIWITDSGQGISPEIQERLFQPFFTTKEIGRGTGLGLGICLGIVTNHGGQLSLDKYSPNTRFIIRLPKHPEVLPIKTAA